MPKKAAGTPSAPPYTPQFKRAVFIVPQIGFNDVELSSMKKVLMVNAIPCTIASYSASKVISKTGVAMTANHSISELDVDAFDCFIFVGGENVSSLASYAQVIEIVKEAYSKGKLLALLCMHPALILPKAGLLAGRKVTVFPIKNGWSTKHITEHGGILVDEPVVADGTIITCRNEEDAALCAETVVKALARK